MSGSTFPAADAGLLPPTHIQAASPRLGGTALFFVAAFSVIVCAHATLLHLPYFWDEGGYYVPAALDFYRTGTLIPTFTNAHPPLPNVVLGTLWHLFGFRIVVTRLTACAFAALGLTALYRLGRCLLETTSAAIALAALAALYPIWFTQSSLVHADIFAAAFTLCGLAGYLCAPEQTLAQPAQRASTRQYAVAACFALSVLSKETAIVQPATLAALELWRALRSPNRPSRTPHLQWALAVVLSIPVLAAWYAYHFAHTGHIFGNPVYLRYNATANFTFAHIATAFRYRFLHLVWQRNIFLPLVLALACFWLPRQPGPHSPLLRRPLLTTLGLLVVANWLAFSVLGGALLTRYLLPIYPLLLLLCLALWQERTAHWPWLAALTGVAFLSALWLSPPTFFAPEDNLVYRDMIVVHQGAIRFLQQHFPDATVLTAWPGAGELLRPELGYTARPFRVYSLDDFSAPEIAKAAAAPGHYDTALVFTTHYMTPAYRQSVLAHPDSWRARRVRNQLDFLPEQIAQQLHGRIVWQADRNGEWAAVLRFERTYEAAVERSRLR